MSTTTREIDDYVTAVHAALADLPEDDRDDLLDDLPQHLADVQAEDGGTLVELIGPPAAYAAELRASAGLDAATDPRPWWQGIRHRLMHADERLGSLLGYERFVDLLRALAPAWWLLRAWLLVEVATAATQRSGRDALVPQVGGNKIVGLLLLVLAVAASMWLGRRGFAQNWQRTAAVLIGVALACYGIALVRHATEPSTYYVESGSSDGDDTSNVSNIYPVGPDGTVLHNVRLYDQDGNPIQIGSACANYFAVDGIDDQGDQPEAAATSEAAATYPCPSAPGPFPSGQASALPGAGTPSASESTAPASGTAPATTPAPSPSR